MTPSLSNFVGQPLTWAPTAILKTNFDLIAPDNSTLATLDMSSWTSKAHATVPEGTLFMHKEGWTGLKVTISSGEEGPQIATYQGKWIGASGQLVFPDGRQFNWGKVNFWGTQKAWLDPVSNAPYVQFSVGSFTRKFSVLILPEAAEVPELSLLLVLGLYNILVEKRKQAAAAAS